MSQTRPPWERASIPSRFSKFRVIPFRDAITLHPCSGFHGLSPPPYPDGLGIIPPQPPQLPSSKQPKQPKLFQDAASKHHTNTHAHTTFPSPTFTSAHTPHNSLTSSPTLHHTPHPPLAFQHPKPYSYLLNVDYGPSFVVHSFTRNLKKTMSEGYISELLKLGMPIRRSWRGG